MLRVAQGATNLLRPWLLGASLLGLGLFGSCARELDEPPPLAGGCTLDECPEPVDMPPTGSLGGASGAAGSGGDGNGDDEPVTLEGTVRVITSADLANIATLTLPVDVIAKQFTQGVVRDTTENEGGFVLTDVKQESALSVTVAPIDSDASLQLIQTLQGVDTTTVTETDLFVLDRDMFDELVEQSFTENPTALDRGLAAAIVTFVDEEGNVLDGVSLIAGNAGVVAYDNGAVYSDALEETGGRGTLVLLNIPTTSTLIRYTYEQLPYQTTLPGLDRGSVTLHTVRFTP